VSGNGHGGPAKVPTGRKVLVIGLSDEDRARAAELTVPSNLTEEELLSLISSMATSVLPALRARDSALLTPPAGLLVPMRKS